MTLYDAPLLLLSLLPLGGCCCCCCCSIWLDLILTSVGGP